MLENWDSGQRVCVFMIRQCFTHVPYSTLAISLAASVMFMGCATVGGASAEKLSLTAQNSSCCSPLILQHSLKGENKDATSSSLIPEAERVAHILAMGYDVAPVNEASNKVVTGQSVSSTQSCGQDDIYTYRVTPKVGRNAEALYETLYVRHMTRAAIKADPDLIVICKPNYIQVYQPPLKLGGSARMILVSNGKSCEVLKTGYWCVNIDTLANCL